MMMPYAYDRFLFWRKVMECKTLGEGEIRAPARDEEFLCEFMEKHMNEWLLKDDITEDLSDTGKFQSQRS